MPRNNKITVSMADNRIGILLGLAKSKTMENKDSSSKLAKRYVSLAIRISNKYKVSIPEPLKQRICKKCGNFMVAGMNCKTRLSSNGYIVYKCECGAESHVFYKKELISHRS